MNFAPDLLAGARFVEVHNGELYLWHKVSDAIQVWDIESGDLTEYFVPGINDQRQWKKLELVERWYQNHLNELWKQREREKVS